MKKWISSLINNSFIKYIIMDNMKKWVVAGIEITLHAWWNASAISSILYKVKFYSKEHKKFITSFLREGALCSVRYGKDRNVIDCNDKERYDIDLYMISEIELLDISKEEHLNLIQPDYNSVGDIEKEIFETNNYRDRSEMVDGQIIYNDEWKPYKLLWVWGVYNVISTEEYSDWKAFKDPSDINLRAFLLVLLSLMVLSVMAWAYLFYWI